MSQSEEGRGLHPRAPAKSRYDQLVTLASDTEVAAAQLWGRDPEKCVRYYRGAAVAWREALRYASSFYERYVCKRHAEACERAKGA